MKAQKMSRISIFTLLILLGSLGLALRPGPDLSAAASQHGVTLKDAGVYESLGAAFQAARYQIHPSPTAKNWQANNPAHHLNVSFDTATGMQLQADGAQLGLQLHAVGYGNLLPTTAAPEAETTANRIALHHTTANQTAIREWFVNDASGLEHGFTLDAPVAERATGQPLQLALRVTGDLRAQADTDGHALTWRNARGATVLRYDGLKAWDATGQTLAASMKASGDKLTLSVTMTIEDADATYPVTIDPTFSLQQKLTAGGEADAFFGSAVALNGNTAVIGASNEDFGINNAQGVVYVFTRSGVLWTLQARLRASDGADGDRFGRGVAVLGDTLAIGAAFDNIGAASDQGSTYVFTRAGNVWTQQQKLVASDGASGDFFGESLALANNLLVIGAPNRNEGGLANSGAVYYFTRSGTVWSQQQKITAFPSGGTNNKFGAAVALSSGVLAIGAPGFTSDGPAGAGAVYIYVPGIGNWIYSTIVFASDPGQDDAFGSAVALSGTTLLVGAYLDDVSTRVNQGSAYVYTRNVNAWPFQAKLQPGDGEANKQFGYAVGIDGDTVVVGARDDSLNPNNFANQGSAYVYTRSGTVWSQQQKLLAPDGAAQDFFGQAVAIDGDTVIAGAASDDLGAASDAGSAYVYFHVGAAWPLQQKLTGSDGETGDSFGSAVAVDGNTAVITATNDDIGAAAGQGSAYVFTRNGTVWSFQQKLTMGKTGDGFGNSAAVLGDTIMIGADSLSFTNGAVYVFTRTNNVWSFKQTLTPNDSKANQFFGEEVAIDGTTAVISAGGETINGKTFQGAAYTFTFANNTWSQSQKLIAPDGETSDQFGSGVAINGNVIVVGAEGDDFGATLNKGSAYFFERPNGGQFSFVSKITSVNGNPDSRFGRSVAVSGTVIAVGAPLEDNGANTQQGAVHLYEKLGASWTFLQRITPATGATGDWFGSTVQLNGTTLAVAAERDDNGAAADQGSVYVYERPTPQFALTQQLLAFDGAAGDAFGSEIALDASTLLVGARSDDILANAGQGSAYIYVAPTCAFNLLTPAQSFAANGGNGSIGLQASAANCTWQAVASDAWINISNKNGTGSATINFTVAATNGPQRNGTITVGGQTFLVTQASGCTFTLNPANGAYNKNGGLGLINVIASNSACPWTAVSNAPWITIIDGASSAGSNPVDIQVAPNVGPIRSGTVTVAGLTFTVLQDGGCTFTLGLPAISSGANGGTGNLAVTASSAGCLWTAVSNVNWITINSGTPGNGSGSVNFTVAPNNGPPRIGTMTVAGLTFTVSQDNGCQYTIVPGASSFTAASGNGTVNVTATNAACLWTAVSNSAWLTINTGANGTGNGAVTYTVAANAGAPRTGTLTIAGQTLTVTQAAPNQPIAPALSSINPNSVIAGAAALTATVTGSNFTANCRVQWNGQSRDTMFVSATQLTVNLPATDFVTETIANVTVFDFNTNQGSNAQPFRVFSPLASVSAASYANTGVAPESIVAGFGAQMATATQVANTIPLPTSLAGTTVRVIDSANVERLAPLFFVSAGQVNYLMPTSTALGKATVVITSSTNHVSVGTVEIALVTPGIFTANAQGNGTAAALVLRVKPGGQISYENVAANGQPIPIDLTIAGDQVFLVLYGTGVRFRSNLNNVLLNVGGNNLAALYAGGTSLEGLDQINAALPNTLIGKGEVAVALTVDGKPANAVRLTFK